MTHQPASGQGPTLTRVEPTVTRGQRLRDALIGAGGLVLVGWIAVQMLGNPADDVALDREGPTSPTVGFTTLDGRAVRVGSAGGPPTVFLFVSTWCPSCAAEATAWSAALAARASSPTVYVVDIDPLDSAEALAAFRDRYGLHNLEFTVDAEQSLVRAFDFPGMDATLAVVGGRIVFADQGPTPPERIADLIRALD